MSVADIHARYVRERRERGAQNIAAGLTASGDPMCNERGIPESDCPPYCTHRREA